MQITKLKILLFLVIAIVCGLAMVQADTKVLREINVAVKKGLTVQTVSLEDGKDLSISGLIVQRYDIPKDPKNELKVTIEFVADKDGFKAKYSLVQQESIEGNRLSPSTLKSLGG